MGRGVAYPYEEFVLLSEVFDDAEGADTELESEWQMDEVKAVLRSLGGTELDDYDRQRAMSDGWLDFVDCPARFSQKAHLLFEFDRFMVGIEPSDTHTCHFVVPLCYHRRTRTGHDYVDPYSVNRDARRLFNALHRNLPGRLSVATSAWTTRPYVTQRA